MTKREYTALELVAVTREVADRLERSNPSPAVIAAAAKLLRAYALEQARRLGVESDEN